METYECYACGHESEYQDWDEAIESGWANIEEHYYCGDCWDECEECHESIPKEDLYWVENGSYYVCESCKDEDYGWCESCDCLEPLSNINDVEFIFSDGGRSTRNSWCDNCIQNSDDNPRWDEEDRVYIIDRRNRGNGMLNTDIKTSLWDDSITRNCLDCRESNEFICPKHLVEKAKTLEKEEYELWVYDRIVRSYHDSMHGKFKSTKLRTENERPYLYYGIELEVLFNSNVDRNVISSEFIEATGGLFVAEYDRSVDNLGNGAEFISRPLSYKKWMSEDIKQKLEEGKKVLQKYHAYNPQPDGCGLHIHMSKRFFENKTEKKVETIKSDMDWLFQFFQPEMEKISNRKYSQYCASKKLRIENALKNSGILFGIQNLGIKLDTGSLTVSQGSGVTHHDAVIETPRTIEVRTFRSSIEPTDILSAIEFCRAIAHATRKMDLKDKTLGDILYCKDSEYLQKYIEDRKIDTSKKLGKEIKFEVKGN